MLTENENQQPSNHTDNDTKYTHADHVLDMSLRKLYESLDTKTSLQYKSTLPEAVDNTTNMIRTVLKEIGKIKRPASQSSQSSQSSSSSSSSSSASSSSSSSENHHHHHHQKNHHHQKKNHHHQKKTKKNPTPWAMKTCYLLLLAHSYPLCKH
ncbi:unnamed protein product [Absidia cylindrospora]